MPLRLTFCLILFILAAPPVPGASLDQGIPIDIHDEAALQREGELVKLSVPLAKTADILSTSQLRLLDPVGVEIPVQWRVLARWGGGPADQSKPIRYALAHFLVDLGAGALKQYRVTRRQSTDGPPAKPQQKVVVSGGSHWITVETGRARFDFQSSMSNLFQSVMLDLEGDGVMEPGAGEWIVKPLRSLGSCLVDTFGGAYLGCADYQPDVVVEEFGPLQAVIRIDGRHMPVGGPTLARDFLMFTTRMYFVAGSSTVKVENILRNTYLDNPLGEISFARYLMHIRLEVDELATVLGCVYNGMESSGGFGWSNFGESVWAKNTHTTGSPRNKLTYFDRFVISGARSWFEKDEIFALHSMDIRPYHIDGFVAEEHPNTFLFEGLPHYTSLDQLGRDQIDPALDPYKAGIPSNGHGWNGYDAEHMSLDDLYEYYLLTGSRNSLDAMEKLAEAMLTWEFATPQKAASSSRLVGWVLRGLMKAYAVTGDPRILARAQQVVEALECDDHSEINPKTSNTGVNTWITSALAIAWRISGRQEVLDLATSVFNVNLTDFDDAGSAYHWFHTAGEVLGK